jgi:ribulose-phosphate 3-epimerase
MLEFSPLCLQRLNLDQRLSKILDNVDSVHLDIMDGEFVPNEAFDVEGINNFKCKIPKHVHIMAHDPDKYINKLKNVDSISFHLEVGDTLNIIKNIKKKNIKVGIVVSPQTSIEEIFDYISLIDRVIIMSVEPGFSGQKYLPDTSSKIIKLRKFSKDIEIAIDGGMNEHTIREVRTLGANSFIVCSVIVKSDDIVSKILELKKSSKMGTINNNLLEKDINT